MNPRTLNEPLRRVLYDAFIGAGKRHEVAATARKMGIPASTLYGYCEGVSPMPACILAQLAAATRDAQLISDLLNLGAVGLTVSVDPAASTPDAVRDQALRLGEAIGDAQQAVRKALADNEIDEAELKRIEQAAEEIERQSETLKKSAEQTRRLRVAQ